MSLETIHQKIKSYLVLVYENDYEGCDWNEDTDEEFRFQAVNNYKEGWNFVESGNLGDLDTFLTPSLLCLLINKNIQYCSELGIGYFDDEFTPENVLLSYAYVYVMSMSMEELQELFHWNQSSLT